jgi:hypothetical protein
LRQTTPEIHDVTFSHHYYLEVTYPRNKKNPKIKKKVSDFPSPKTYLKFNKNKNASNVYTVQHVKIEVTYPRNLSDLENLMIFAFQQLSKIHPADFGNDYC